MKIRPTFVVDALAAVAALMAFLDGVARGRPSEMFAVVLLVMSVARVRRAVEATEEGLIVRNMWSTLPVDWADVWGFRVESRGSELAVHLILPLGQTLRLDATRRLRFLPRAQQSLADDVRRLEQWQRTFAPPTERRG